MASRDDIIRARLNGTSERHAGWVDPVGDARADALVELREIAGGRVDLLMAQAGLMLGYHGADDPGHEHFRIAAQLLVDAADGQPVEVFEQWFALGEERKATQPFAPGTPRPWWADASYHR